MWRPWQPTGGTRSTGKGRLTRGGGTEQANCGRGNQLRRALGTEPASEHGAGSHGAAWRKGAFTARESFSR